jgi:hypothetical protein
MQNELTVKREQLEKDLKELSEINLENCGEGPWQQEPGIKHVEEFTHKGYKCVLQRNFGGAWCGYVGIPKEHPIVQHEKYADLDVHGGVTWSEDRLPRDEEHSSVTFWVGFDCAHYNDYIPIMEVVLNQTPEYLNLLKRLRTNIPKVYRTFEFAKQELINLIEQIERYEQIDEIPIAPEYMDQMINDHLDREKEQGNEI